MSRAIFLQVGVQHITEFGLVIGVGLWVHDHNYYYFYVQF